MFLGKGEQVNTPCEDRSHLLDNGRISILLKFDLTGDKGRLCCQVCSGVTCANIGVSYNNSINQYIQIGKMIGTVRSRTNFILTSQSWEIGSPPTGSAGRMKLSCVMPTSVIHI